MVADMEDLGNLDASRSRVCEFVRSLTHRNGRGLLWPVLLWPGLSGQVRAGLWGFIRDGLSKNLIVKFKEYRGSIVISCDDVFTLFKTHDSPTFGQS